MIIREYQPNEPTIQFYSYGKPPFHKLSNFNFIETGITHDELVYPSTEHAFQAQKYIKEQRHRFSVDGDLGSVDSGFLLVFGNEAEDKKRFWMQKNNIGIIAKMATNIKISKKIGLIRDETFVSTDTLWIELLTHKFNIDEYKIILQNTENKYLLEFSKSAKKIKPLWSGIIEDGTLYGTNLMGNYLMYIRGMA